jgi:hypothetical protein
MLTRVQKVLDFHFKATILSPIRVPFGDQKTLQWFQSILFFSSMVIPAILWPCRAGEPFLPC